MTHKRSRANLAGGFLLFCSGDLSSGFPGLVIVCGSDKGRTTEKSVRPWPDETVRPCSPYEGKGGQFHLIFQMRERYAYATKAHPCRIFPMLFSLHQPAQESSAVRSLSRRSWRSNEQQRRRSGPRECMFPNCVAPFCDLRGASLPGFVRMGNCVRQDSRTHLCRSL